jgi:hypothetical protein
MKTRRGTIVMIIVGVLLCVVIVGVGAAVWFFVSVFDSVPSDEVAAAREFDAVRQRLGSTPPLIAIRDGTAVLTRRPPDSSSSTLSRVRILAWEADQGRLSRVAIPWWLIRMKAGSFDLNSDSVSRFSTSITISPEEIERFGPALIIEHTEADGSRVLAWTE